MTERSHISETLRWIQDEPTDWGLVAAGGLGIAVPLWIANAYGHLPLGLAGAVGSLLMGNSSNGRTILELARNEVQVVATLAVAVLAVFLLEGHGVWTDLGVVLFVALAAVVGGYSNKASMTTSRFIIYLCIMMSAASGHDEGIAVFILMVTTAAWTSLLIVIFGGISRIIRPPAPLRTATGMTPSSPKERRDRFLAALKTLRGWQFPIRITAALLIAVLIAFIWPTHRYFWVAITVALICQRPLETWPIRTTQRAIGTIIGVAFAYVLLASPPSTDDMILTLGIICALRLYVRNHNYLIFSALITPVIMMILDAGRPVEINLLVDRVAATLMAAVLVILINAIMVRAVEARKVEHTG
jgi:hypothetical protein